MTLIDKLKCWLHLTPNCDPSLVVRNIAYFSGSEAHVNNKLDIFLPAARANSELTAVDQDKSRRRQIPVIVHVHGGGWVRGSRISEGRGGPTVGRTCAQEGFIGVVVSYRLARISLISYLAWSLIFGLIIIIIGIGLLSWQLIVGYFAFMIAAYGYNFFYQVRKPVNIDHMMDDIARALVYIRDHINEHCSHADPNQIFLSGHSAGSHLISLLVLDKSHLQRHHFSLASIQGVIATSGIYSLTNPTHDSENNIRNWIFRILYSSNLIYPKGKTAKDYSPIEYIKEDDDIPPFLVMSARFDMGLEVDGKRFYERFQTCRQSAEYYVVSGTHGNIASNFSKNDARKHFFEFIRQHTTH
ncbi:hypothetical protein I4U23_024526 [Adineta vaga]|nr:hypothetical protein I4U23_024526 [Adineta vaga]